VRVAMETELNASQSGPVAQRFSLQDIAYCLELTLACIATFWIITRILRPLVESASDNLLGGMWAVVATVFVFRNTRDQSLSAGISRMIATSVSFVLCLAYLLFLPFNPVGMAALIGIGTLSTMLLGRRNEIVTTGITTAVVMVVAALSPPTTHGLSRCCACSIQQLALPWVSHLPGRVRYSSEDGLVSSPNS
jgi:uncharacterized membrane protein YccC